MLNVLVVIFNDFPVTVEILLLERHYVVSFQPKFSITSHSNLRLKRPEELGARVLLLTYRGIN